MPGSTHYGKLYSMLMLRKLGEAGLVRRVIDAGCGGGTYRLQAGPVLPGVHWTGIEAWEPYVARFGLDKLYDRLVVSDLRKVDFTALAPADLVIFGDVLEHMTRAEAQAVVARASAVAPFVLISIPVVHYPQEAVEGNPFEEHVKDDWNHDEVMHSFAGISAFFIHDHIGVYFLTSTAQAADAVNQMHQVIPPLVRSQCPDDRMAWGQWQTVNLLAGKGANRAC